MINIHLNGDIIRCPDIAVIKERLQKSRDKLLICQFNKTQYNCPQWNNYCRENHSDNNHIRLTKKCDLCNKFETIKGKRIYKCDKAQERSDNANKIKHFRIDNQMYRKVASAGHYLMKISKSKSLFLSLTFPPWKAGFNPYKNENVLNNCFSKFVENLHNNYGCEGYIAVRELGKENRRYHYHFLCSIPFHSFIDLNNAWNAAISDICEYSGCALSSKRENRLINKNNPAAAVRYLCKYISKSKNQSSKTRIVFISNNLFRKPVTIRNHEYMLENKIGVIDIETYLLSYKSLSVTKLNDYCTAFRINENTDFDRICTELIYPIFNLDEKKSIDLYAYPDKPPD
jgi:hypothetical protein